MKKADRKSALRRDRGVLEEKDVVLDMNRRILAYEMALSAKEVPHVCFVYEPEVTAFVEYFRKRREELGLSISFNTLMLKVITEGMKASPILNSHLYYKFRSAKGTLHTFEKIDVNMPTIMPNGSMQSLTVRDAAAGGLVELDAKIGALLKKSEDELAFGAAQMSLALEQTLGFLKKGKIFTALCRMFGGYFGKERLQIAGYTDPFRFARESRKHMKTADPTTVITKDDIREGTVIVSNVGSLDRHLRGRTVFFEILPPQIFAVMVGNLQKKPVAKKGEDGVERVEVGTIMPFLLAFDHRACDFDALLPFMKRLDEIFADPTALDAWL